MNRCLQCVAISHERGSFHGAGGGATFGQSGAAASAQREVNDGTANEKQAFTPSDASDRLITTPWLTGRSTP